MSSWPCFQAVELKGVSKEECEEEMKEALGNNDNKNWITDQMMCAGDLPEGGSGKYACQGDSGGNH